MLGILAEPETPRRWQAVCRRWGMGTRIRVGYGERELQEGSATRPADHHSALMQRRRVSKSPPAP